MATERLEHTDGTVQPRVYSVDEVATMLQISHSALYRALSRGDIPNKKVGGRVVIPRRAFERWLEDEER